VIEAIVENLDAKRALYGELDTLCPPHTIFASNTSSLTIIEMAAATQRPRSLRRATFLQSRTGDEAGRGGALDCHVRRNNHAAQTIR
jgi:hypothetical protein